MASPYNGISALNQLFYNIIAILSMQIFLQNGQKGVVLENGEEYIKCNLNKMELQIAILRVTL